LALAHLYTGARCIVVGLQVLSVRSGRFYRSFGALWTVLHRGFGEFTFYEVRCIRVVTLHNVRRHGPDV
jgi:hypothetical protein